MASGRKAEMGSFRAPRYDCGWVMRFAQAKHRAAQGQRPFAESLKEAWATAKEIAEGEAMRAERARRAQLFAPESFDCWILDYIARFQDSGRLPLRI
jgi:hypothetical protein